MRFIHELTASDTSKTAKKQTGDITHQHIVNVLLSNITFL